MIKEELRPKIVYYCDICGTESRFLQCRLCNKNLCEKHMYIGYEDWDVLCPVCSKLSHIEYNKIMIEKIERQRQKSAISREKEKQSLKRTQLMCSHDVEVVNKNVICKKCNKIWKEE